LSGKEKKLRVPPEAFTAVTLDEIAGRLADIYDLNKEVLAFMKRSEPQGLIHPVTLDATEDLKTYYTPTPWFSVDVYNCLSGSSLVFTNPNGPVPIKDLEPGNFVYSFDGQGIVKNRVLAVLQSGVKPVYELRTQTRLIKASDNHPFLALRRAKGGAPLKIICCPVCKHQIRTRAEYGYTKCIKCGKGIVFNKKRYKIYEKMIRESSHLKPRLVWKSLKDLKAGDLIVILRSLRDEGKTFKLPNGELTNKDFMQVVGLFVGDGWLRIRQGDRGKRGEVNFSVFEYEPIFRTYLKLIERVLGVKAHYDQRGIHVYSIRAASLFKQLGLDHCAKRKKIPQWIFSLPRKQKLAFIRGYVDSDGQVDTNGAFVFCCRSRELMQELRHLVISVGLRATNIYNTETKRIEIRNEYGKLYTYDNVKYFGFRVSGRTRNREVGSEDPRYLKRLYRPQLSKVFDYKFKGEAPWLHKNLAFDRVKSVKYLGEEEVFDIAVENAHNFFADGILVHNSGPNTVYVGINDKAKEFKAIEVDRGRSFDFGMAKIEKIYYKCSKGETATFDLTGTY